MSDITDKNAAPADQPPPAAPGNAPRPGGTKGGSAHALKKAGTQVSKQVSKALDEWLAGMNGPQNPPFCLNAKFPDSEWGHFFRIFAVSTALAGTIAVARSYVPKLFAPVLPDAQSLKALTIFACFGVIYSLYSRIFGVSITVRQALFCFALILTPWLPLYALIRTMGGNLGIVWFLAIGALGVYVFSLTARAIHIVSGAHILRVILSLLLGLALAVTAVVTYIPVQPPAAAPAPAASH